MSKIIRDQVSIINNLDINPDITNCYIGPYLIIELQNEYYGGCYFPDDVISHNLHYNIMNKKVKDIINLNPEITFFRCLILATINAFFDLFCEVFNIRRAKGNIFDLVERDSKIVTIGYFPDIVNNYEEVRVIERNSFNHNNIQTYDPEYYKILFDDADWVIITGSSLVYGGMESYLFESKKIKSIVYGPTSSMFPSPFFNFGANYLFGLKFDSVKEFNNMCYESCKSGRLIGRKKNRVYMFHRN